MKTVFNDRFLWRTVFSKLALSKPVGPKRGVQRTFDPKDIRTKVVPFPGAAHLGLLHRITTSSGRG
jgi:hypothetical protein